MVLAIVQARIGSKRLPNKSILNLKSLSIIEWVYLRLKKCKKIDKIIFAIPDTEEDNILQLILNKHNVDVIRGAEHDVLSRYDKAVYGHPAKHIIRVCGDRPLIDWSSIDLLIEEHKKFKADYSYNHYPINNNWPIGFGAEICTKQTFDQILMKSKSRSEREHIFNYLLKNKKQYKIHTFDLTNKKKDYSKNKLDLDDYNDYLRLVKLPINVNMDIHRILNLV